MLYPMMTLYYLGETAAFATAVCWAITSTAFEDAGKKMGSVNLNFLRLLFGFIFLSTFTWVTRGMFLPLDATPETWSWLLLSGFFGVLLIPYAVFIKKESVKSRDLIGSIIAIAGLGIMFI